MTARRVFLNGRIFTSSERRQATADFNSCMVIDGEKIIYVGQEGDKAVQIAIDDGFETVDLANRVVVPGFIDAHTHILLFGLSLRKLDLTGAKSLEDIRQIISAYAGSHPDLPRILCRGWHQPSTGGEALASALDDLDPRPIFVEALDLHSTWCNTSALRELPIEEIKRTCSEHISCDAYGHPTGLLSEGAQTGYIWPHLIHACSEEEKQAALHDAFEAYVEAGYTGLIDMAMDTNAWDALKVYRERHGLPLHVAAHWFIPHGSSLEVLQKNVDQAIALRREWHPSKSPGFCIVGIKLIADGVVDGCTAALSQPYAGGTDIVKPLWPADDMNFAVDRAVKGGLQCAIHAIGDAAITQAINAIANANNPEGRHRIEHLELTTEEDVKRLGSLGITASVQPVHSDPALVKAYSKLIGEQAWKRAFAYREFLDNDAPVALGTDAPTARHLPLPNLYNAVTRKSATEPTLETRTHAHQALTLSQALHAATTSAAYSRFADTWTGTLREGLCADFVVLDTLWTPETLLEARVWQTWSKGQKLFQV